MLHQQVVRSSEDQIRLSKGVIAKFFQTNGLGSAIQADASAARAAGFAPLALTPRFVALAFPAKSKKATAMVAFWFRFLWMEVSLFLE